MAFFMAILTFGCFPSAGSRGVEARSGGAGLMYLSDFQLGKDFHLLF